MDQCYQQGHSKLEADSIRAAGQGLAWSQQPSDPLSAGMTLNPLLEKSHLRWHTVGG